VVARDRGGVIPLLVHRSGDRLLLSDHLDGFLALGLRPEVDWEAVADFFTFFWTLGAKTFVRGVMRFPAGAVSQGGELRRYFTYRQGGREGDELKGDLGRALRDAVARRLEGEAVAACHLSGGVDTSVVALLASRVFGAPLHTYSIRVPDGADETRWILRVLQEIKAEHRWVEPQPGEALAAVPEVARILGEPSCYPSVISRYFLERDASHPVILNGRGVDELFSGYAWHLPPHLEGHLARRTVLSKEEIGRILPGLGATGYDPAVAYLGLHGEVAGYTPLERTLHVDYHTLLRSWVQVEYAISNAFGHVAAMPALDASILDIAGRARSEVKASSTEAKLLFREAFRDLLPAEILRRPKMGLHMPFSAVLRRDECGLADSWLQEAGDGGFGEMDLDHLRSQLERHRRGEIEWGWQFWGVFCYMHWKRAYILGGVGR
jgi:asparagine synthase (glutamine-hydrolysing)